MKKIKDLNKYLTSTTGLDAKQRQQWRDKMKDLSAKGEKEEYLKVFFSFSYFKENYL